MTRALIASAARQMPRAIAAPLRANADVQKLLSGIEADFRVFKAHHDDRLSRIQGGLDDLSIQVMAVRAGPGRDTTAGSLPADPEYRRAYASWAKKGTGEDRLRELAASKDRSEVQAAMSVSSNPDGGYVAPVEWDRRVSETLKTVSPIRQLATVLPTTVSGFSTLWNDAEWASGWGGETVSRPATATAQLKQLAFADGEIYAQPMVSQKLLSDAAFDIEEWIVGQLADEFTRQEGVAFLSGDGANKPFGFLQYVTGGSADGKHPGGNVQVTPSGNANNATGDGLIDLAYGLKAPYRANATWLMSSLTLASIRKLKDGQGNYLWQPNVIVGQPSTLLGYPVYCDEGMPSVAAGATPIAFGDFRRGYLVVDRLGITLLRDPYTNKPFVGFYAIKRVGGGVYDPNAIRLLKIAAS